MVLGRTGSSVVIDPDVCVKTGVRTDHRVLLRGETTPSWISVLLLFTVVGYLLASAMSSRPYRVTVPFSERIWRRWRTNRRLAYAGGLIGVGTLVASAVSGTYAGGLWLGVGLAFIIGAIVAGAVNAWTNNVGIRATRDDDLVLTRVSPAFAEAVRSGAATLATR